jgi:hypothetical protein
MRCPQCGAENPDDAKSCNLCFARFNDGSIVKEPEKSGETEKQSSYATSGQTAAEMTMSGSHIIKAALNGGLAAMTGVIFFLGSIGLIKVFGLGLGSFLFMGRTVQTLNLTVFLMTIYLFSLLTGGVFGNVMDRPNTVLLRRSIAASCALLIWLALIYMLIVRNAGTIVVTTGVSMYTLAMLVVLVVSGITVAFGDGIEKGITSDLVWYETAGGAIGSIIGMVPVIISMASIGWLVSITPESNNEIAIFIVKLVLNTSVVGFLIGFFYWAGCEYFRGIAAKRR